MARLPLAAIILFAAGALASAQSNDWHPVPPAQPVQTPFPLAGKLPLTVEIRPASAISAADSQLASNEDAEIRRRAGVQLIDIQSSGWHESQIDCPAFPGHLFLRFTRVGGKGDVSAFTASIPRFNQGRDRIIPIQRRGYSLWSPAPVNAQTIAVFNHVLAEERVSNPPEWAAIAVCYAALAGTGGEGTLAPVPGPILQPQSHTRSGAILHPQSDGGAIVEFETPGPAFEAPSYRTWNMVFDRNGVLKKATHKPLSGWNGVPAPQQPQWKQVPGSPTQTATR